MKLVMKHIAFLSLLMILLLCACHRGKADSEQQPAKITAEMAYEGVNNYCHGAYDWSPAEDNPSLMYITMGEETEKEYQVIFRSYTGALVYFYVDKATGKTRMVEHVPAMNVEEETGSIDLWDYIER